MSRPGLFTLWMCRLAPSRLHEDYHLPLLARTGRAGAVAVCLLSGPKRTSFAPSEHFAFLTQLYGPAVRCKPKVKKWRGLVLRICIRPLHGAFVLLAIMDIRAHPISFSERP